MVGGAGIGEKLYVGGDAHLESDLYVTGHGTVSSLDAASGTQTGALMVAGGIAVGNNIVTGGKVDIRDTTLSGDSTLGALVVAAAWASAPT